MRYCCQYESPIGTLYLGEENGHLSLLVFAADDPRLQGYAPQTTPLLEEAKKELAEYFAGRRRTFELPLQARGTEFQKRVWTELQKINYGKTCSYKDIAERIDCPLGSRAVGLANNRNPISILIPCHRVLSKDGKLTGYAGGLDAKRYLLKLEQSHA